MSEVYNVIIIYFLLNGARGPYRMNLVREVFGSDLLSLGLKQKDQR